RGGGNPETVGEREPGDAGALTTDAGLVGDETAHAALKREAEGGGAGERASDDDVAHGDPRVHVGEGVQDDDATVAVLVGDLQGRRSFRSRARPLCLSAWPLCGAWWEARRLGSVRSSLTLTARRRTRSTLLPLTRRRRCASLAVEGNQGVTGALPAASSDVQCGQRRARSGMLMAQWPHSFVAGAAGDFGNRRLTCLTTTNTANATIRKLITALMKSP